MSDQSRRKSTSFAPDLEKIHTVAIGWVLGAVGLAVVVFVVLEFVVDPQTAGRKDVADLEILKAALTIVAAVGVVLGGVYAYRKQHLAEGDAHRSDADLFADRYTAAAEQLGNTAATTRMAGVYAMARLADDWEDQRQTCIDVLCSYLRLPVANHQAAEEREVRRTLLRVMRNHLHPECDEKTSWRTCNFSFEGAEISTGDLTGARFEGESTVSFHGVRFGPEKFHFTGVCFAGRGVWFTDACFEGRVSFDGARFESETIDFSGSREREPGLVTFRKERPKATEKICWGPFESRVDAG